MIIMIRTATEIFRSLHGNVHDVPTCGNTTTQNKQIDNIIIVIILR